MSQGLLTFDWATARRETSVEYQNDALPEFVLHDRSATRGDQAGDGPN
jgi:hypothetical protein